ncbi:MAG: queuosine precursor transporter [Leptospiraceae bacterium]|nr:queuosine precursor transporter [Leptospiraceae bacterium]
MPETKKQKLYFVLSGFFILNALLGELTGGKIFQIGKHDIPFLPKDVLLSVGVIMWPVVFIFTDIINEYFGREGVRKVTFLAIFLILFAFVFLWLAIRIPAAKASPVDQESFARVFGQSLAIIIGSITAFAISQLVDVIIFTAFKKATHGAQLWLRATGSTAVSQLVDTFVVGFIAFVIPGSMAMADYLRLSFGNYVYKLLIAIAVTPIIYLLHFAIDLYLQEKSNR